VARKLTDQDLLICSGDRPEALAGIMGGQGTMVEAGTTALFLESANFHAATIRRTSMRLGLRSDASARFEKAQDPANAEAAVHLFLQLLQQYCPGAAPSGPLVDPRPFTYVPKPIVLRRARLLQKLGLHLEDERTAGILRSLGFAVEVDAQGFTCAPPSHRATKDIASEDDLIEEVGRMFRYDNIPERPLVGTVAPPPRNEELFLVRRLLEVACGEFAFSEAYNYTFVPDAVVEACGAAGQRYELVANPVAPEQRKIRRHACSPASPTTCGAPATCACANTARATTPRCTATAPCRTRCARWCSRSPGRTARTRSSCCARRWRRCCCDSATRRR
jgi:phenylalanyl-tRNA synthetase beta chain